MAVFAFLNDDRHSKTADVHRDSHGLTPSREVWPTACRCVQRLAAEAALPVYHDSTGFARVTLIYKKKRPEPKFGSLFGAEDGTFPRTLLFTHRHAMA